MTRKTCCGAVGREACMYYDQEGGECTINRATKREINEMKWWQWLLLGCVIGISNKFIYSHTRYMLPKSEWECTARDVRPTHGECVEYHVKEKE